MVNHNFHEFSKIKGQCFACLNIRSLYANHSSLELDLSGSNIYIIGLVETWLKPHIPTGQFKIEGYNLARLDRQGPKRGGGIGCYIRSDLHWEYMEDIAGSTVSTSDIEMLTIKLTRNMQRPIILSVVYIPPNAPLSLSIDHLDKLGDKIITLNWDWILMGDFNVNLLDSNTHTSKLKAFASRNYLYQLIKNPTRVTINTQSLIDHIYVNINPEHVTSYVIKYGLSDHDMIGMIIKKPTEPIVRESFTCRNSSSYTIEALKLAISESDWTEFDEMTSVEVGWDILYRNYLNALSVVAPLVRLNNVKKRKSWTTPELLNKIRKRDQMKSNADSLLNNTAYQEFKKSRNEIKRDVIKAKRGFVMRKIATNTNNPRKYWKELNDIFNPKDTGAKQLTIVNKDGSEIPQDEISDYMNKYFSGVGHNLASRINIDNSNYLNALKSVGSSNRNDLLATYESRRIGKTDQEHRHL